MNIVKDFEEILLSLEDKDHNIEVGNKLILTMKNEIQKKVNKKEESELSEVMYEDKKEIGQPKGTNMNKIIGLKDATFPKKFIKRADGQKIYTMIRWLCSTDALFANVLNGEYRIKESDLKSDIVY